ncbi:hypothetical protein LTR85_010144 [Meristemomyces frigidus]|nr:hypothetical protein LTR85_010144 [Meristemomyces frigidus]
MGPNAVRNAKKRNKKEEKRKLERDEKAQAEGRESGQSGQSGLGRANRMDEEASSFVEQCGGDVEPGDGKVDDTDLAQLKQRAGLKQDDGTSGVEARTEAVAGQVDGPTQPPVEMQVAVATVADDDEADEEVFSPAALARQVSPEVRNAGASLVRPGTLITSPEENTAWADEDKPEAVLDVDRYRRLMRVGLNNLPPQVRSQGLYFMHVAVEAIVGMGQQVMPAIVEKARQEQWVMVAETNAAALSAATKAEVAQKAVERVEQTLVQERQKHAQETAKMRAKTIAFEEGLRASFVRELEDAKTTLETTFETRLKEAVELVRGEFGQRHTQAIINNRSLMDRNLRDGLKATVREVAGEVVPDFVKKSSIPGMVQTAYNDVKAKDLHPVAGVAQRMVDGSDWEERYGALEEKHKILMTELINMREHILMLSNTTVEQIDELKAKLEDVEGGVVPRAGAHMVDVGTNTTPAPEALEGGDGQSGQTVGADVSPADHQEPDVEPVAEPTLSPARGQERDRELAAAPAALDWTAPNDDADPEHNPWGEQRELCRPLSADSGSAGEEG